MLYNTCLYAIIYIFLIRYYVFFFGYNISSYMKSYMLRPIPPSVSVGVTGVLHEYA